MKMSARLPRLSQSCSPRSLSVGQRLLLGCYIPLFALVLPFICWGALAEPGHPHRAPHFVFADPLLAKERETDQNADDALALLALAAHRQHVAAPAGVGAQPEPSAICQHSADSPVGGRATPTLLLFTILLLVAATEWRLQRWERLHFVRWVCSPLPRLSLCPVLLPPPRLSFTFSIPV